ncbi:MAG: S1C family serine protease [Acidimicrobiales bacterium]
MRHRAEVQMSRSGWRVTAATISIIMVGGLLAACSSSRPAGETAGGDDTVALAIPGADVPDADVAAQFGDAVWRVETEGCGWLGSGTAFAIDARHLVTNHHVIANDTSPTLRSRNGEVRAGRVIGAYYEPDVAVIEVDADLPLALPWTDTASLREAERVVVIGYPIPARQFTFTSGSVVAFVGSSERRDALLSNAPVERGNSGGPALRGDGTVTGVVTQMTLADPSQRVAIVFTAANVLPAVDEALANPVAVLSDCGLGPDYIPTVPDDFDIDEPPPSPSTTTPPTTTTDPVPPLSTLPPLRTTSTTQPEETTTTVACPEGNVGVTVFDVTAVAVPDQPGYWNVQVAGAVGNASSATVFIESITVTLDSDPAAEVQVVPDQQVLDAGGVAGWDLTDLVYSPAVEPAQASPRVAWEWTDPHYSDCPPPAA